MDRHIEHLRALQRKRELNERRAQRKIEEAKARTLKSMAMMYNKPQPGQKPTANATADGATGAAAPARPSTSTRAAPDTGAGGSGGGAGVEMSYARLNDESGQQV